MGTKFNGGQCTELVCSEHFKQVKDRSTRKGAKAKAKIASIENAVAHNREKFVEKGTSLVSGIEHIPTEMEDKLSDLVTRLKSAGVPANLTPDQLPNWSKDKLLSMLPEALAELHWQLRFGTAKERGDAVDRVLDANGLRKKEGSTGAGGMVVLNIGGNAQLEAVPWLKRALKPGESE